MTWLIRLGEPGCNFPERALDRGRYGVQADVTRNPIDV